jgi:hypothetical protein
VGGTAADVAAGKWFGKIWPRSSPSLFKARYAKTMSAGGQGTEAMDTTEQVMSPLVKDATRIILNIAPERGEDLAKDIFGNGNWTLATCGGKANFYGDPPTRTVTLSFAGMASVWSLAYAAYHIVDIGSRTQRAPKIPGQSVIDIGREYANLKLNDYLNFAQALFKTDKLWPTGLAQPNVVTDSSSVEGRINNVFYGALSWMLLHEVGHIHHQHLELIPAAHRVRQEHQADSFATTWILEQAGNGLQLEFRVLMISVALTWLFLSERAVGKGADHPAAILRFREAVALFKTGARSVGVEYASYLFKAVLDPTTDTPSFDNAEELFDWTCQHLEKLFQAYEYTPH